MAEHQYILEKGSKKYHCPECNKRRFVRYINTVTGNYLPKQYGRCDRESNCSYFLNPYIDGYVKSIKIQEQPHCSKISNNSKIAPKMVNSQSTLQSIYFDFDTFKQTLQPERYEKNTFIQNLFYRVQFPFEVQDVTKVIELYRLGTVINGYRARSNTFPFIDIKGNVRAIQVKQFDETNHTIDTDFLHSIIEKHYIQNNKPLPEWLQVYIKQDKRVSCLFGEHLLSKYPFNPVALVEAPKTAVYGTLYFGLPKNPQNLIWLAVYNKSSFSLSKLKVLQGRDVFIFPDLSRDSNTFKEWEIKAKDFENQLPKTRFIFSNLLEQLASEDDKSNGNDLADYLIKQDWRLFRNPNILEDSNLEFQTDEASERSEAPKIKISLQSRPFPKVELLKVRQIELQTNEQPQNWNKDIVELETYFTTVKLPTEAVKLNQYSTITNVFLFIESHFAIVRNNKGNRAFLPYLNRLKELKRVLIVKSN